MVVERTEEVALPRSESPKLAFVEKRLVELAVVLKKLVVVALVLVLFKKVMFWKVEEPVERRLPNVPRLATVRPPVKFADEEIVWPLISPEVMAPVWKVLLPLERAPLKVRVPPFPVVKKRLVLEAVVAKKLVEVPLVEVELRRVMFWKVLDPFNRRLESVVRPAVAVNVPVKLAALDIVWPLINPEVIRPAVKLPMLPLVEKRLVELAVVEK